MSFDDDADWSNAERQAVYRLRRRKAGWVEYRRWLPPEIADKVRAYANQLIADFDAPVRAPVHAPERKLTSAPAATRTASSASKGVGYERVTIRFARPPGTQFANSLRLANFQPSAGQVTWLSEFETVVGARGELRRMVEAQGGEWISEPVSDDDDDHDSADWLG